MGGGEVDGRMSCIGDGKAAVVSVGRANPTVTADVTAAAAADTATAVPEGKGEVSQPDQGGSSSIARRNVFRESRRLVGGEGLPQFQVQEGCCCFCSICCCFDCCRCNYGRRKAWDQRWQVTTFFSRFTVEILLSRIFLTREMIPSKPSVIAAYT